MNAPVLSNTSGSVTLDAVGFAGTHRNTNGGVALGYGYGQDGAASNSACEFSLWTTAQNMRNAPPLKKCLWARSAPPAART